MRLLILLIIMSLVSCSNESERKFGEPYHPSSEYINLGAADTVFVGFDSIITYDVDVTYTKDFKPIVKFVIENWTDKTIDVLELEVTYSGSDKKELIRENVHIAKTVTKDLQFPFTIAEQLNSCSIVRIHYTNGKMTQGHFVIWGSTLSSSTPTYNPRSSSEFH